MQDIQDLLLSKAARTELVSAIKRGLPIRGHTSRAVANWLTACVYVQSLAEDPDLEDLCSIACADKQQCSGAVGCGGSPSHHLKHTAEVQSALLLWSVSIEQMKHR